METVVEKSNVIEKYFELRRELEMMDFANRQMINYNLIISSIFFVITFCLLNDYSKAEHISFFQIILMLCLTYFVINSVYTTFRFINITLNKDKFGDSNMLYFSVVFTILSSVYYNAGSENTPINIQYYVDFLSSSFVGCFYFLKVSFVGYLIYRFKNRNRDSYTEKIEHLAYIIHDNFYDELYDASTEGIQSPRQRIHAEELKDKLSEIHKIKNPI